jgi:hypothetical protein
LQGEFVDCIVEVQAMGVRQAAAGSTISSNRFSTVRSRERVDSDARQWIAVVEMLV